MDGGARDEQLIVRAPLPGRAVRLTDVPDQVFAQAMVGPGLAIDPGHAEHVDVLAPVSGVIATLFPHAFAVTVTDEDGGDDPDHGDGQDVRTVLVHLGIDTVALRGDGFVTHVLRGDRVHAGDLVVSFSPRAVADQGLSTMCPVVGVQVPRDALEIMAVPGRHLQAGDPVFGWA